MVQAGKYREVFDWRIRPTTISDSGANDVGDTSEWTSGGNLWGSIQTTAATTSDVFGGPVGTQSAIVVLRQHVNVKVRDRLIHRDLEWWIDGVRFDWSSWETVCDCTLYEANKLEDA